MLCSRVFGGCLSGLVFQRFVMALYGLVFIRYPRVMWGGPCSTGRWLRLYLGERSGTWCTSSRRDVGLL